ncbi:MAG: ribonucleoside-diphosphate reductase [Actinomycetota bacterium]|nr:ribonucleoside-diphosphate reductase [Actinomycetota bacterium]
MEHTPQTQLTPPDQAGDGLSIRRRFTTEGEHPFDAIEWEPRAARIGHGDKVSFEQRDVEFPRSWSQNATNIVAQKYFRGQVGSPARERSVKQMISRVAGTIANWGRERGYFATQQDGDAFEAELIHILLHQMAAFNSPVWFNVGWHPVGDPKMQASACFILSAEDSMESILEWNTKEGIIFRGGSGSGINLSKIRGSMEPLSRGGTASGPVSFMRGADAWAGSIKSGGGTRRAAKMVVLDIDHPDIREFIWCKAKEEDKAAALRDAGFDMSIDGDGFHSIQYQNANNSVRVTDEFMRAVENDADWRLIGRASGEPIGEPVPARQLMSEIAEAAWRCADPGVQYDTTINQWHTSPNSGRINASNPCFPADAKVHTTKGLLPISELIERGEAGEKVRVYTHRVTAEMAGTGVVATQPIAFMRNGVSRIVRLRFTNGARLRCTPNHRIWTLNRGYVRAEELTERDEVMLNDSPTPATDSSWALPIKIAAAAKSFSRGANVTLQELPDRWSEGLGELTGHLIGDGWLTDVQTGWVYGGDDVEDGLSGAHEGMIRELVGNVSRQEMSNGTVQLRVGSEAVRELFRGLGVRNARAHEKRVPQAIFTAPTETQAAFLRGLFGADGCVSRVESGKANRYVGLGSRSDALLRDVQRLLGTFGIRGRIFDVSGGETVRLSYTRVDGTEVRYQSRPGFDLRITGTDLERFAGAIGFSTPRKNRALDALLGETTRYATKPCTRLIAREDDGQEQVYNLTEPLHHSYMVDGFVVANCSEYMHVDDSACNLASLNLMKFRRADGTLDVDSFKHAVDIVLLAQEIIVSPSSYPTEQIAENARAFRQLGLGYANLGAYLMADGVPYDSDAGRGTAAAITSLMTGRAYLGSARVAAAMGPYDRYAENRDAHNAVMRMHRDASYAIPDAACVDGELLSAARACWEQTVAAGEQHGYRNAQATVLAPTGTISFLMDCDTTGVEPDFSLVKFKELVGGGQMTIVNGTVPLALQTLGYSDQQIEQIEAHINEYGTIIGAPGLSAEHLPVFDVAVGERAISHMGHLKMMGAVQPFISGAISKTVNLPQTATVDDIADAYLQAWRLGVKALAIYRDGSKTAQALRTDAQKEKAVAHTSSEADIERAVADALAQAPPKRRRMPRERQSITHKFSLGGHEGYITAGMYEDGTIGEIFLTDIGKEGSTLRGMMNSFATAISISLQYGVPLETLVRKFSYMRFEPEGMTTNPEIPFAKSMPDYIMRWLASRFLDVDLQEELGILTPAVRARKAAEDAMISHVGDTAGPSQAAEGGPERSGGNGGNGGNGGAGRPATSALTDTPPVLPAVGRGLDLGPACQQCGGMMQRTGSCYTCGSCGFNTGCG